jgi:hypothetical protein
VAVDTPLGAGDLRAFVDDVERLLRINPLLEFASFREIGPLRHRFSARNLSNGRDVDVEISVARRETELEIRYSNGLKSATVVRIEALESGSRLVITDFYGEATAEERQARLDEVDRSLNAWGRALHAYLRRWARWRWLAPWRWYMTRVWQPMTPSARRIVFLLLAVSVFEVATLALVALVWLAQG